VKCRGRRRRGNWEEGEGRERRFHPKHMGGSGRQDHVAPCFFLPSSRGRKRSRNVMMSTVFGREEQTRKEKTTKPNDETKL
jgi:hypothetical protein